MKPSVTRPKSAIQGSSADIKTSPRLLAESLVTALSQPLAVATASLSTTEWNHLFRSHGSSSEHPSPPGHSFSASHLRRPQSSRSLTKPRRSYKPVTIDMLSHKSKQLLRKKFRPAAQINAYLMYTSAVSAPKHIEKRLEKSPQPYTEWELERIRKAPSVEKLLKLVGPNRGLPEKRTRIIRKAAVNTLKVPILDGAFHSDTASDEEREQQATRMMQTLHLRFCSTSSVPEVVKTPLAMTVSQRESVNILAGEGGEGGDEGRTAAGEERMSTRTLLSKGRRSGSGEMDLQGDSVSATWRVRPLSANDAKHVHPAGRSQYIAPKQMPGPPESPYAIRLKGRKVRDCIQRGAMFRPAVDVPSSYHAFGHPLLLKSSPAPIDRRYYP